MEEKDLEQVEETQQVEQSKFMSADDDSVIKVDLNKPLEDADREQSTDEVPIRDESETSEEVREENVEEKVEEPAGEEKPEQVQDEQPTLEEVTDEEEPNEALKELVEEVEEAVEEAEQTGNPLPESIQKLVDFMEETGGDIEDYVRLNQDYSKLDNLTLLREFYKQTKPHLNSEEINFMMEDVFSYDEDLDDEKDIKRKKLALKEQVAQAKQYLDDAKSKYYEEIKSGSKLSPEQQKAVDFFNRYNKKTEEQKVVAEKQKKTFMNKTNQVFNKNFKGFEYNVGDKKFRFNVKNADSVKDTQSDINNFLGKFLNEDNTMSDASGYHKSIFTAMNADAIAQHFYEQGKADALKDSIKKSKNISMNPRQTISDEIKNNSGFKVKVLGDNSKDFKFRIKNKK